MVGEIDAAGLELLRPLRGRVLLASPAHGLRRAGFLAELGWERLRSAPDDASRLAPAYGGQLPGAAAPPALQPPAVAPAPEPPPPLGASPATTAAPAADTPP